jgi:hypothetical protein
VCPTMMLYRVESCGEYARKLKYIINPSCRFCGHSQETIFHLLDDCIGTDSYRQESNININTLTQEKESSLLKIARFDAWVRTAITYDSMPPGYRVQSTLNNLEKEIRKRKSDVECNDIHRPKMKNCLVIPDRSLNDTNIHTKIRRIY